MFSIHHWTSAGQRASSACVITSSVFTWAVQQCLYWGFFFFFADYMNCPSRVVCCKSSNWRLVKLQQHVRLARHLDGEWSFFNSSMQSTLGSHYLTNARIHVSVAVTSPLKMQPLTLLVIILEYFLIVCMLLQIVPVQENKVRMTAS